MRLLFTIQGKEDQGIRLFYAYSGTPPTAANCNTFASQLLGYASDNLPPIMSASNVVTGAIVEDLSSVTGGVGEASGSYPGTLATPDLPSQTAFVSSYEIPVRYRGGHPRSYWPFGTAAELSDENTWTTAFVDSVQSYTNTVIAGMVGQQAGSTTISAHIAISYFAGFTPVQNPLTKRYRNVPNLRPTPVTYDVTTILYRPYVGSLRRRRVKTS
jgi:hypothetical protein